ncbi:hypothetical protein Pse7367_1443 [Thalassoporum mexicanum PCC 7367]|uniref:DUF3531 family protein n=1 Tax=Thalassoporum mexicanum TaxID=3457544 RepID=UPI00029FA0E2|nr:DUF3531 family protein [Pseudanabaena sp. PCC 7367]AFY69734.1 hypothetical protein Pse7367_1443 [Pseudanabaena sp. PCC 7367]
MQVKFRDCDWFDLWLWIEFENVPSVMEKQIVDELFNSWFLLGKLGGFNAVNMQVQETGVDISYFDYDVEMAEEEMMSLMHNMGDVEYEDNWARCWVDLGTADAIAIDILINALQQFSKDYVAVETLIVGGQNEDWPTDDYNRN